MRTAARRDANEREIIDALEKFGARVHQVSDGGTPDLLVAFRGRWTVIEVKDGNKPLSQRKLTPAQVQFMDTFSADTPTYVVSSVDEALRAIGVIR